MAPSFSFKSFQSQTQRNTWLPAFLHKIIFKLFSKTQSKEYGNSSYCKWKHTIPLTFQGCSLSSEYTASSAHATLKTRSEGLLQLSRTLPLPPSVRPASPRQTGSFLHLTACPVGKEAAAGQSPKRCGHLQCTGELEMIPPHPWSSPALFHIHQGSNNFLLREQIFMNTSVP